MEVPVVLEEQPVLLDGLAQLTRLVRPADPGPGDRLLGGRDGRGRVDLERPELLGHLDDVSRALRVEQLRAHGESARIVFREAVHVTTVPAPPTPRRGATRRSGHGTHREPHPQRELPHRDRQREQRGERGDLVEHAEQRRAGRHEEQRRPDQSDDGDEARDEPRAEQGGAQEQRVDGREEPRPEEEGRVVEGDGRGVARRDDHQDGGDPEEHESRLQHARGDEADRERGNRAAQQGKKATAVPTQASARTTSSSAPARASIAASAAVDPARTGLLRASAGMEVANVSRYRMPAVRARRRSVMEVLRVGGVRRTPLSTS